MCDASTHTVSEDTIPRTAHFPRLDSCVNTLRRTFSKSCKGSCVIAILTTASTCTSTTNPTDLQHHSAHTYEVRLGSTTPLRNPSATARSTFVDQADLRLSTGYEPNLYYEDNTSNLYVSTSGDTVQSSATSSETEDSATTLPASDILYRKEFCQQTKFPTFLREK